MVLLLCNKASRGSIGANLSPPVHGTAALVATGLTTIKVAAIVAAAARRRVWHPESRLRGRQAWSCRPGLPTTIRAPMAQRQPHVGTPRLLHQLIEPRAILELYALPWLLPVLARAPRGDGHPVLLLPGFMADEGTMIALKLFLENRGYDVHAWGFGRNVGFSSRHASALQQKIRYLHHRSGRKVSLVGWSLGGLFAMYGAHEAPECVRSVITLGAPVTFDPAGSQSPPLVKALYRVIAHPMGTAAHVPHLRAKSLRGPKALPVPITCLYSLSDGVVPPQEATIDGNPALHENVRVPGSHLGLGFNAVALWIVADRLAQPEGRWQPFAPAGITGQLYRLLTSGFAPAWQSVVASACGRPAATGPAAAGERARRSPGSSRARTARRPRGRASARGRTWATR
jgi:pimeloyl-ACP methyl ester carboxylesterase